MSTPLRIRDAISSDIGTILNLIVAGAPEGEKRTEDAPHEQYESAFSAIQTDPLQRLVVVDGEDGGIIATMQLTRIPGLSNGGQWRMLVEAVHVSPACRGQGIGEQMMQFAIAEARNHGCGLVQLTSNKKRLDAHRFYKRLGFVASHEGLKLAL